MPKRLFIMPFLFLLVTEVVWAEDSQRDTSFNTQPRLFELHPKTCLLCATVLIKSHGQALALKREFESTDSGITIRYLLGDSGNQEDMDWAVEMLKRTKRILVATSTKGGNPPLCPLCALVSDMIKSGAELTAGLKDSECIAKILYPDSLAEAEKIIAHKLFVSITKPFEHEKDAAAIRANVSIGIITDVRIPIRDTGISFSYVPPSAFQTSKLRAKAGKTPTVLKRVLPEYPPLARTNLIQGSVAFEVLIDTTGQVIDQKLLHRTNYFNGKLLSDSITVFDSAVRNCLKQWVFKPTIVIGRAVRSSYQDSIVFRIAP